MPRDTARGAHRGARRPVHITPGAVGYLMVAAWLAGYLAAVLLQAVLR